MNPVVDVPTQARSPSQTLCEFRRNSPAPQDTVNCWQTTPNEDACLQSADPVAETTQPAFDHRPVRKQVSRNEAVCAAFMD